MNAKQADIGKRIDDALVLIEQENPRLGHPRQSSRAQLDGKLGELVDLVSPSAGRPGGPRPGVEYFLGGSPTPRARRAASSHPAKSTLVAGTTAGCTTLLRSGGMFVQSERFIRRQLGDVSIYGQESNPTTWRLTAMNIRGMDYNLGGPFTRNQHPDPPNCANPPFNISVSTTRAGSWHRRRQRQLRLVAAHALPPIWPRRYPGRLPSSDLGSMRNMASQKELCTDW